MKGKMKLREERGSHKKTHSAVHSSIHSLIHLFIKPVLDIRRAMHFLRKFTLSSGMAEGWVGQKNTQGAEQKA